MNKRVRLSTVALAVVFAGLLALYVEVRPPPVSAAGDVTVESTTAAKPARSRSPTDTPTGTKPPARTAGVVPSPSIRSSIEPTSGDSEPRPTSTAEPTSAPSTGSP